MKLVRWIGAYGHADSLHAALNWELVTNSQIQRNEVCAEPIPADDYSRLDWPRVGLLARRGALVKLFRGDCWSVRQPDGRLRKTRHPKNYWDGHGEAWIRPDYAAIVVRRWDRIQEKNRRTVIWFARRFSLPILEMRGKKFVKIRDFSVKN